MILIIFLLLLLVICTLTIFPLYLEISAREKKRIMSASPIEVVLYIQFFFFFLHTCASSRKHSIPNHKNAESTIPQIDSHEFYDTIDQFRIDTIAQAESTVWHENTHACFAMHTRTQQQQQSMNYRRSKSHSMNCLLSLYTVHTLLLTDFIV